MKAKKNHSKLIALLLSSAMLIGVIAGSFAAPKQRYSDVPSTHWASEYIEAISEGGLVEGYPNGTFAPDAIFSIAHMATIIARANANDICGEKNGYWAYNAVDYCVNKIHCLPDQGEINNTNYGKPCTREMATYMMVVGLGIDGREKQDINASDIPDYEKITPAFRNAVLMAYQYGITIGTDSAKTFNPQGQLKRSMAAAMLVRAGFTSAAVVDSNGIYSETIPEGGKDIEYPNGGEDPNEMKTGYTYGGLNSLGQKTRVDNATGEKQCYSEALKEWVIDNTDNAGDKGIPNGYDGTGGGYNPNCY